MLTHPDPSIGIAMDVTFDDNLSYITNPQERRRVQNRISQRNYRERMKNMESSNKSRQTNKPLTWTQPHTIPRPPGRKRGADQVPGTIPPTSFSKSPRQRQPSGSPEEQFFMITPAGSDCSGPREAEITTTSAPATTSTTTTTTTATATDIQWASDMLTGFDDGHHTPELQPINGNGPLLTPPSMSSSLPSIEHVNVPFDGTGLDHLMTDGQMDGNLSWPDEDFGFTLPPSMRGFNTLHIASHKGQATIIRTLLATKSHLDVDSMSGDGRSALHIAALARHADVVQELLRAGANALQRDCDGQTAMHMAAKSGDIAVAEQILTECAECLLLRDNSMQTPLHQAVIHGHEDMVKFLLERGADPAAIIL